MTYDLDRIAERAKQLDLEATKEEGGVLVNGPWVFVKAPEGTLSFWERGAHIFTANSNGDSPAEVVKAARRIEEIANDLIWAGAIKDIDPIQDDRDARENYAHDTLEF